MKAILEFNLDDLEDERAHLRAIKALDMALVLWEINYNTKKKIYNRIESENLDLFQAVYAIFNEIENELHQHGVDLEQLIV